MPEININFDAPPVVGDFLGCDEFVRLIVGPVGSGKSSGCCMEGLRRAMEMPPSPCCEAYKQGQPCECRERVRKSRGAIVRNTLPQLRDTTMKTWREWIPEHLGYWKLSEKMFVIDFPLGDGTRVYCEVLFRALDDADDVRNLLSLELTWIYFNEWREINKAIHDAAQTRVGRYPRKEDVPRYWTGVFGDSNAFDTDHYLYKLFKEPDPETGLPLEGHRIFEQPGGLEANAENREHLDRCFDPDEQALAAAAVRLGDELNIRDPQVMKEARREQDERLAAGEHEKPCRCYYLRMMRGKRQSWIDCYIHNKYVFAVDGKPIYDNFNQRIHVAEFEVPKKVKVIYHGQDYGLTPAIVFAHVMPDGQIRISHEFVSERMGALNFGTEAAKLAKREFPGARLEGWGDPAGMAASPTDEEKTPISVVNGCGLPTSPAPTNEWTIRRDAFGLCLGTLTMTGEPEILIHPRCKTLIKACAGAYCLKRKKVTGDEQFHDHPDKNEWSHVAEAAQYLVVGLGRDRRVLDGGVDDPERVQSVRIHRSTERGAAEDGPRVTVSIRRSTSRR
jgi:hypothetical protein